MTITFSRKKYRGLPMGFPLLPNKSYIYVLFASHANKKETNLPFHLGYIKDTTKIERTEEVFNYQTRFSQDPVVHVILTVNDLIVEKQAIELNHILFKTFTENTYIRKGKPFTQEWDLLYQEMNSSLKVNKGIRLFPILFKNIQNRKYPTSDARKLSLELAQRFSLEEMTSVIEFRTQQKDKQEQIVKTVKQLNGDWYLKEPFEFNKQLTFHISLRLLNTRAK